MGRDNGVRTAPDPPDWALPADAHSWLTIGESVTAIPVVAGMLARGNDRAARARDRAPPPWQEEAVLERWLGFVARTP